MFRRFGTIAVLLSVALGLSGHQLSAEGQKVDALIGTWVLNVAKSTLSPPPKSQVRTFDYTNDGMVMCTMISESRNGTFSFFHWFTNLDGVQHQEFSRGAPDGKLTTTIALKKTGDRTLDLVGKQISDGKVHLTGTVVISNDGKTMTWTSKNLDLVKGTENNQVRIYEKQ